LEFAGYRARKRGLAVKKVNRYVPDVPQRVADRGTEIVERHLAAYGVSRAMDLPEEGKVRLMHELQSFFGRELPEGLALLDPSEMGWRGALKRFWRFITGRRNEPRSAARG
ncbi:MAG TPA: hypothetical protein VFU47_05845, partial [Armatimonadota bacterium]|nr:hypothetical protein [Armatimonadota bacterium]